MKALRDKARAVADNYLKVSRWLLLVGGICVVLLMLYTTGDVTGRYTANQPLPASFELAQILMIFIVFLSLAYVQARGGHLRLEFVSRRLSPRGQAILHILALLMGFFFLILIAWQGLDWTMESWQTKDYMQGTWKVPYFPARLGLTIGAFLFCIQYIIDLTRHIGQLLGVGKVRQQQ